MGSPIVNSTSVVGRLPRGHRWLIVYRRYASSARQSVCDQQYVSAKTERATATIRDLGTSSERNHTERPPSGSTTYVLTLISTKVPSYGTAGVRPRRTPRQAPALMLALSQ